jgi:hypothetical protein
MTPEQVNDIQEAFQLSTQKSIQWLNHQLQIICPTVHNVVRKQLKLKA